MRFNTPAISCVLLVVALQSSAQDVSRMDFTVTRGNDTLVLALLGGLDAPQITACDLNRDEVSDLVLFDRVGNVLIPLVFKGPPGELNYEPDFSLTDSFPYLQEWVIVRDFNGDGIEDIFASTNTPGVQGIDVYRGRDIGGKLAFSRMTFDLGPFDVLYVEVGGNYTPIYSAWIDYPAIEDVDGDGDLDILTFEPGGVYMPYQKNLVVEQGLGLDTFLYDIADICWGKFKENEFSQEVILSTDPNKCAGNEDNIQIRHSGSASAAFDYDADGDLDLYLGDLASPNITVLTNGGTAAKAFMTAQENMFPNSSISVDIPYFATPMLLDVNHDGLTDFLAANNSESFVENYDVLWYYRNDGSEGNPDFNLRQTDLFVSEMLDFGTESRPATIDIDADGLLDIIVGTGGYYDEGLKDPRLILLRNIGDQGNPEFTVADEDFLGFSAFGSLPTANFSPEAGDLDGDGDIDLIIGEETGSLFYLENLAGPGMPAQFDDPVYPYKSINVGAYSTPAIVDVNADGLKDLVIGERLGNNDNSGRCSNLNYFQNTGSAGAADFIPDATQAPNTQCLGRVLFNTISAVTEFSSPAFYFVPDGLEMITGSSDGALRRYSNITSDPAVAFEKIDNRFGSIADGFRTSPELADIDADGLFEIILGNKRGGITAYDTQLERSTTSVFQADGKNVNMELWPNPCSERLYISGISQLSDAHIEIFDSVGRLVTTDVQVHSVDVRAMQAGTYFLRVRSGRYSDTLPFVITR